MRAEVLIQNDPENPQKWSNPILCDIQFCHGIHTTNLERESFLSIFPMTDSASVKTYVNNNTLAAHAIQPEYVLKDSSWDYFKLPDSLNLEKNCVYQRYTITRAEDIKRAHYLKNYKRPLSVKFGLIFGTEENKNLFKLYFRKEQLYNESVRRGTKYKNWFF